MLSRMIFMTDGLKTYYLAGFFLRQQDLKKFEYLEIFKILMYPINSNFHKILLN